MGTNACAYEYRNNDDFLSYAFITIIVVIEFDFLFALFNIVTCRYDCSKCASSFIVLINQDK